jgi:cyclic pyranopterin phosphate synthase
MDVGGATQWSWEQVLPRSEMLERLAAAFGPITPLIENGSAPADRFRLEDGTTFGIISSTTTPFCNSCDRSRLTADGIWYLCLYAEEGVDLRSPLREGGIDAAIRDLIADIWRARADRGAEARRDLLMRGALHEAVTLRSKPHLEMHTRGG